MTKEIKQEDLWDWICSQIGFNKEGKEIQRAIRKFIEGEKQNWEKEKKINKISKPEELTSPFISDGNKIGEMKKRNRPMTKEEIIKGEKIIKEFREEFCVEPCENDKGKYLGRDFVSEVHSKEIEDFWLSKLEAQKQDLLKKIKEINVGTLGGSIIISRKDLKQLLK